MTLHSTPANPVPEGAVSGDLTTLDGKRVRYARWNPSASRRGTVCLLLGRGDMIEKYFEVVEELRSRGFAVAVLDWRGQGGSQRLLSNPRKGHIRNFDDYQLDLEVLMREVVLPDCPPPIFALAHSMGSVILLEAARQGRRWFDRVVLVSPMIDLAGVRGKKISRYAAKIGAFLGLRRLYVPGGGPISDSSLPFPGNQFTSDLVRYERSAAIIETMPELGLGSPTFGWAYAAFKVMDRLNDPTYPTALRQPMLIVAAGEDNVVSTPAIEKFAMHLRAGAHLIVAGSRHEIMMERDIFRTQFWAAFDAFIPGSLTGSGALLYR